MDHDEAQLSQAKQTLFGVIAATVILVLLILIHYQWTLKRTGTIVLPAGANYFGPTKTP